MNEITPDLIAKIATRLYNEIPGAGHVPEDGIGRGAAYGENGGLGEVSGARRRRAQAGRGRPDRSGSTAAHLPTAEEPCR